LQIKHPALKEVKFSSYTGRNGCLGVWIPRGIAPLDELEVYRFISADPPKRSAHIMKINFGEIAEDMRKYPEKKLQEE
jgi:hypothetical protein